MTAREYAIKAYEYVLEQMDARHLRLRSVTMEYLATSDDSFYMIEITRGKEVFKEFFDTEDVFDEKEYLLTMENIVNYIDNIK